MTNPRHDKTGPAVAQVTFSEGGDFGAASESERRGMPVFSPRGISYRPCEGDNILIIPADGADVCAGVMASGGDLAPGELRLTSSGGASIRLTNSGDIVINGLTISKEGRIIEA